MTSGEVAGDALVVGDDVLGAGEKSADLTEVRVVQREQKEGDNEQNLGDKLLSLRELEGKATRER